MIRYLTKKIILQDNLRAFANQKVQLVLEEQIREKAKGRNHDLSVMEYKLLAEEKAKLVQECDTLSMRAALRQMDYEEANEKAREACERVDRMEAYLKKRSDAMEDLEERNKELFRKAELAGKVSGEYWAGG